MLRSFLCRFALFLLLAVEAREIVFIAEHIAEFAAGLGFLLVGLGGEAERFLAGFVELYDLEYPLGGNCDEVDRHVLVGGVCDEALEDISLEVEVGGVGSLKAHIARRHTTRGLHVGVDLEVEAAFELGALAGKLLWIERYILISRGAGGHGYEIGHPLRATQRTSARTDTADTSCLLTRADLLHLYADLEGLGENLYQLAEVDTLVGDIIEYGLVAIALILHVADLHVEIQALGNFAGTYHGVVLARLGLLEFLDVGRLGQTEHTLGLGSIAAGGALHAQLCKCAGKGDGADVMAGSSLYGHDVARSEGKIGGVAVISLAGVLELNLYNLSSGLVAGDICKPVEAVQLASTAVLTAAAGFLGLLRCFGLLRGSRSIRRRSCRLNIFNGHLGRGALFFLILSHNATWRSLPNGSRGLR